MSDRWGKVASLMQTQNETSTPETKTSSGRYAELQQLVAAMASDFQKFYQDGNKAAGTRVRIGELATLLGTDVPVGR